MINEFKAKLLQQKNLILAAEIIDKSVGGDALNFDSLISVLDENLLEQKLFGTKLEEKIIDQNFIAEKRLCKIGNIGIVCESNDVHVIFQSIIKGLICKNNIVVNVHIKKNTGVITCLIEQLNQVLKMLNLEQVIRKSVLPASKFVEMISSLDKMLIFGSKTFYQELLKTIKVQHKYIPFGQSNIILLTKNFKQLKFSSDANYYSNENYMSGNFTHVLNVKEAIDLISCSETQYMTSLFTESSEDALYFLNSDASDYLLVNAFPQINKMPLINQIDFLAIRILVHTI